MDRMKIGDRVNTPHGIGTIIKFDNTCDKLPRAGVLHDIFPDVPKMFTDDILYYFLKEIELNEIPRTLRTSYR